MGDPVMAASASEDKFGESVASDRRLEVSVSFGRFENDLLSWEKWSTFSQNKYLEEVEKCATPGSVAQKKAYFEAHYKKIAARKAEQLDQKTVEAESPPPDHRNGGDSAEFCGQRSGFDEYCGQTAGEIEQETKLDGESGCANVDDEELNGDSAVDIRGQNSLDETVEKKPILNKPEEVAAVNIRGQDSLAERVEKSPILNKREEVAAIEEQATQSLDLPNKLSDKEIERISKFKQEPAKSNTLKKPQKISPSSNVRDVEKTRKKPAPPVAKSSQVSATKTSKTAVTSSNISSTLRTPAKKVINSPLPKRKVGSIGGSKKVAPKSLHMSISMDTPSRDPAPAPAPPASATFTGARKSFIMEKMKDKEIVKRAFKTFQNNFSQLRASAEERSLLAKQVPTKGSETKVSSSITPRKENAGSLRAVNMDKKTAKTAPSIGLRSSERPVKSNEKLQDKLKGKQTESTRLQTKSKDEKAKDSEIRKSRYGLNFKATPMPKFYQGQKVLRSPLDKEGSKTLGI